MEHELAISIRHYLTVCNPDTEKASRDAVRKIQDKRRDIMYDDLSDEGDEYKKDFAAAIESIE